MKTFFKLLVCAMLLPQMATAAAITPGDIRMSQRNPQNTNYADVIFPTQANSLIGTDSAGHLSLVTIGSGLDLTAGILTSTGGGGGAPTNATYITQTPNGSLSAEQALSLLSTGFMYVTTTTGLISSIAPPIPVSLGGSGQTAFTNGQLLIGNTTSGGLDKATLTAGSGVTITNGPGSIIVGFSGSGSGNVTNNATLASGNVVIGGGTSVVGTTNISISGNNITIPSTSGGGSLISKGASITPEYNLIANVIIPTWGYGTDTFSANSTLTFATTPVADSHWSVDLFNSSGSPIVFTLPAGIKRYGSSATLSTITVAGGATTRVDFTKDSGSIYASYSDVGTLIAGTGISVSNSGGAWTINATGSGSGNVTASAPLTFQNLVIGGGGTSIQPTSITVTGLDVAFPGNITIAGNSTFGNLVTGSLNLTGNIVSTTVTDGQIFIGNNTGDRLQLATITAGTGITVTNGPGSITINATGGGSGNVTSSSSASGQAAEFSSASNIVGVNVIGTGNYVKDTTPTLRGIVTTDGANVTTANAMGALVIDVTKGVNTKSVSGNTTFTFSGTPATANTWFSLKVTNTDTADHVATIPSSKPFGAGAAVTTATMPASSTIVLTWLYNGSTYDLAANTSAISTLTEGQSIWITNSGGNTTVSGALKGLVSDWNGTTGTDNSAVIQAAFPAGVVRHVILPTGNYRIASTIAMCPGSTLEGRGWSENGTTLAYTGTGTAITISADGTGTQLVWGGRISHVRITGTYSTQVGAITISDTTGTIVEDCQIQGFSNGFGIEMKNVFQWTENTQILYNEITDTQIAFKFTIAGGLNSFARTRIKSSGHVLTGDNDRMILADADSYIYSADIFLTGNIFSNSAPSTTNTATCFAVELGVGAAITDGDFFLYTEVQKDRNYGHFKLAADSWVNAHGYRRIIPSTGMSPLVGAAHPYDNIDPAAALYLGPNDEFCIGTFGGVRIGAHQPTKKVKAVTSDGQIAVAYLPNAITKLVLSYEGISRLEYMTLKVSTGAFPSASNTSVEIVEDSFFNGTPVFDRANPPVIVASSVANNPFLMVTLINTVASGSLHILAEIETDIITGGSGDYNARLPIILFPDLTGITLGSAVATARTPLTTLGAAAWTNGLLPIGNGTSGLPDRATLTAGTGISITNGAGSITINATGSGSGNVTNNATLTSGRVILGGGTTAIGPLAAATNGQLLIGNTTSGNTALATLTAGTGISITNGASSITIDATGSGSGNVTNSGTLTAGNIIVGGGTTVVTPSAISISGSGITAAAATNLTLSGGSTSGGLFLDAIGSADIITRSNTVAFRENGGSTNRATIRPTAGGSVIFSGSGTGTLFLAFDSGTGGVNFGDGAFGTVASVSSTGIVTTTGVDATASQGSVLNGVIQTNGANVVNFTAMTGNVINVGLANSQSTTVDRTFTLSGTPGSTDTFIPLKLTNTDSASHTMTLPAGTFKSTSGATITTIVVPAGQTMLVTLEYLGSSTYLVFGDGSSGTKIESIIPTGSAVSLTSGTHTNITSVSLPAGVWDVSGHVNFTGATATVSGAAAGITSTTATVPSDGTEAYSSAQTTLLSATNSITLQIKRFVLASTTTVYLVGTSTFTAGTVTGYGQITAISR